MLAGKCTANEEHEDRQPKKRTNAKRYPAQTFRRERDERQGHFALPVAATKRDPSPWQKQRKYESDGKPVLQGPCLFRSRKHLQTSEKKCRCCRIRYPGWGVELLRLKVNESAEAQ